MDTNAILAQAEDLVGQADYGLLVTLANAQFVERSDGPLYEIIVPEDEQERFGMSLVYEEFMLNAARDPIPAALSTRAGIEAIHRLAFERLARMSVPVEYRFVVKMMLCPPNPVKSSRSFVNPLLWLRVGKVCR